MATPDSAPSSPLSPNTRDRKDSGQATDDEQSGDEDVFVDASEAPVDGVPLSAGGRRSKGGQKVGVRFAAEDQHAPSSPHSGDSSRNGSNGGGSAPGSASDIGTSPLALATAPTATAAPPPQQQQQQPQQPQQSQTSNTAVANGSSSGGSGSGGMGATDHSRNGSSNAAASTALATATNIQSSGAAAAGSNHPSAAGSVTIGTAPTSQPATAQNSGAVGTPAPTVNGAQPTATPTHPPMHTPSKPAPPIPAKPPIPLRPGLHPAIHAIHAHHPSGGSGSGSNGASHHPPSSQTVNASPAPSPAPASSVVVAAGSAVKDSKSDPNIIRPIPLASASGANPPGGADIDPALMIKNLDTGQSCDLKDAAAAFPEVAMTLQSFDEQVARATEQRVQAAAAAAATAAHGGTGASGERRPSVSVSSTNGKGGGSGAEHSKEGHPPAAAPAGGSGGSGGSGSSAGSGEKEPDDKTKKESLGFLGTLSSLFKSNPDKKKPLPSNIVKTSLSGKKKADLGQLKFIQGTMHHTGPIWTVSFSHDGCYIATGGQDSIVRVWAVTGSPSAAEMDQKAKEAKDKAAAAAAHAPGGSAAAGGPHQPGETGANEKAPNTTNPELEVPASMGGRPIVKSEPFRMYSGHKADVIDLAWSKANFLLSASIDKTVRLWHVSRAKCLCLFQHNDFVTAVAFHPIEDKFFVSGSFDKKLRIWNIPEHRVVEWAQTANIITAATFSPSGKMAVAGLYNGQCVFYLTEGLKYRTQVDCRNRHGKYRRGKKVTGLQFTPDGKKLLITTNDSRIRLYDMDDYSMLAKYKGLVNDELQIKAYFSPDTQSLICGSENSNVYVWPLMGDDKKNVKKESYEYFKATANTVTCAQFFPRNTIHISAESDLDAANITHMIVAAGYGGELKFFENRREIEKPKK